MLGVGRGGARVFIIARLLDRRVVVDRIVPRLDASVPRRDWRISNVENPSSKDAFSVKACSFACSKKMKIFISQIYFFKIYMVIFIKQKYINIRM